MGKLHALLAAEGTVAKTAETLLAETADKFKKKENYFAGSLRTLELFAGDDQNAKAAQEAAERSEKLLVTSVYATLDSMLKVWATAEDLQFRKNRANQLACADLELEDGTILAEKVPVDELMGLEARLRKLRTLFESMPTNDASRGWIEDKDRGRGFYKAEQAKTSIKTEKRIGGVMMAPATAQHQAVVEKTTVDAPIGKFTDMYYSGCATSAQKADVLVEVDQLIVACRKARNQANDVEVPNVSIGAKIAERIMAKL